MKTQQIKLTVCINYELPEYLDCIPETRKQDIEAYVLGALENARQNTQLDFDNGNVLARYCTIDTDSIDDVELI